MKKFAWLSLLLGFGLWFGGCAQDTDTGLGTDTGMGSTVTDVEPGTETETPEATETPAPEITAPETMPPAEEPLRSARSG